ncbi:MAG: amidase family protein [Acidiferrobacterales bacterium]|nr:amidase family protein [Acidiferrobacterales bacterium]
MIDGTIHSLRELILARETSVSELLEQYLTQIQAHNAYCDAISVFSEQAVRTLADTADRELADGANVGALHGIPILVDDLIDVAGMRTSYGCQAYSNHVPDCDSMSVLKLREAGAIIIGKTTTSELGAIVQESQEQFIARSPWGEEFVSGGGASGVSVAQANNFAAAGLAMDIGGNVMLPAAYSGVFAMRPSLGRIAHTPVFSGGLVFPSVSIITSGVRDCALLMNVLCGYSDTDPISTKFQAQDLIAAMQRPIRSLRIVYSSSLWDAPYDDDSQSAVADAVTRLLAAGCRVDRAQPAVDQVTDAWETIYCANLQADHGGSYRDHPDLFGEVAQGWLNRAQSVTTSSYIAAEKKILRFRLALNNFFEQCDVLITSAVGCVPFAYGTTPSNLEAGAGSEVSWVDYASVCSFGALSGFPTAIMPGIMNDQGLPVALQVMSRLGNDDLVLSVCARLMHEL